jgi:hypothetical protein
VENFSPSYSQFRTASRQSVASVFSIAWVSKRLPDANILEHDLRLYLAKSVVVHWPKRPRKGGLQRIPLEITKNIEVSVRVAVSWLASRAPLRASPFCVLFLSVRPDE